MKPCLRIAAEFSSRRLDLVFHGIKSGECLLSLLVHVARMRPSCFEVMGDLVEIAPDLSKLRAELLQFRRLGYDLLLYNYFAFFQ